MAGPQPMPLGLSEQLSQGVPSTVGAIARNGATHALTLQELPGHPPPSAPLSLRQQTGQDLITGCDEVPSTRPQDIQRRRGDRPQPSTGTRTQDIQRRGEPSLPPPPGPASWGCQPRQRRG